MLTKGIIKAIDYNGNTCTVRIPLFETAQSGEYIVTATVSNQPGMYNGYKENDIVWLGFETDTYDEPVIIGKFYMGATTESRESRGATNFESLSVTNKATVPFDTKLANNVDPNIPNTQANYTSLSKLSTSVDQLDTTVEQANKDFGNRITQLVKDVDSQGSEYSSLFSQTSKKISMEVKRAKETETGMKNEYSSKFDVTADNIKASVANKLDTATGVQESEFGWDLTSNEWNIFAKETVSDTNKAAILADAVLQIREDEEWKAVLAADNKTWEKVLDTNNSGTFWFVNGIKAMDTSNSYVDASNVDRSKVSTLDIYNSGDNYYWAITCSIYNDASKTTSEETTIRTITPAETKKVLCVNKDGLVVAGDVTANRGYLGEFTIGESDALYTSISFKDKNACKTALDSGKKIYVISATTDPTNVATTELTSADEWNNNNYYYEKTNKKQSGLYADQNFIHRFVDKPYVEAVFSAARPFVPDAYYEYNQEKDEMILSEDVTWDRTKKYYEALTGVYVGTDGIKVGNKFSVDTRGNIKASKLELSPELLARIKEQTTSSNNNLISGNTDGKGVDLYILQGREWQHKMPAKAEALSGLQSSFNGNSYFAYDVNAKEYNITSNLIGNVYTKTFEASGDKAYSWLGEFINCNQETEWTYKKPTYHNIAGKDSIWGKYDASLKKLRPIQATYNIFKSYQRYRVAALTFPKINNALEKNTYYTMSFKFNCKIKNNSSNNNEYCLPLLFMTLEQDASVNRIRTLSNVAQGFSGYDYLKEGFDTIHYGLPNTMQFKNSMGESFWGQRAQTWWDWFIGAPDNDPPSSKCYGGTFFMSQWGLPANVPVSSWCRKNRGVESSTYESSESSYKNAQAIMQNDMEQWITTSSAVEEKWSTCAVTFRTNSDVTKLSDIIPKIFIAIESDDSDVLVKIKEVSLMQGYTLQEYNNSTQDIAAYSGGGLAGMFNITGWDEQTWIKNTKDVGTSYSLGIKENIEVCTENTMFMITGKPTDGTSTYTAFYKTNYSATVSTKELNGILQSVTKQEKGDTGKSNSTSLITVYRKSGSSTKPSGLSLKDGHVDLTGWSTTQEKPTNTDKYVYVTTYAETKIDNVWASDTVGYPVELFSTKDDLVDILRDDTNGIGLISYDYTKEKYYLKADTISGAMGSDVRIGSESATGENNGFTIQSANDGTNTPAAIYSGDINTFNKAEKASNRTGVYVGTNGINLGDKFKVTADGEITATGLKIAADDVTGLSKDLAKATSDAVNDVNNRGYQTEQQVTQITNTTISTTNVTAENLKVKAANIDGTVTAGALIVKNTSNKEIFNADKEAYAVTIGGFKVSDASLYNNIDSMTSTSTSGIYLGLDGIKIGQNFKVDNKGKLTLADDLEMNAAATITCGNGVFSNRLASDTLVGNEIIAENKYKLGDDIIFDTGYSSDAGTGTVTVYAKALYEVFDIVVYLFSNEACTIPYAPADETEWHMTCKYVDDNNFRRFTKYLSVTVPKGQNSGKNYIGEYNWVGTPSLQANSQTVSTSISKKWTVIRRRTWTEQDLHIGSESLALCLKNDAISFENINGEPGHQISTYNSTTGKYDISTVGDTHTLFKNIQVGIVELATAAQKIRNLEVKYNQAFPKGTIVVMICPMDGTKSENGFVGYKLTAKNREGFKVSLYGSGSSDIVKYIQWVAFGY